MKKTLCIILSCVMMSVGMMGCSDQTKADKSEENPSQSTVGQEDQRQTVDEQEEELQEQPAVDGEENEASSEVSADEEEKGFGSIIQSVSDKYGEKVEETISSLKENLLNGKYWVAAIDDETAVYFYADEEQAYIKICTMDGEEIQINDVSGSWTIGLDGFEITDSNGNTYTYEWFFEMSDVLENMVFELINGDMNINLYQSSAESEEEVEALVEDYLTNAPEENSDYSKLCEGYVGYSIVDAFFAAGENPSFEHRAEVAGELGIEDYKGTAEQNLQLIELCGGTATP